VEAEVAIERQLRCGDGQWRHREDHQDAGAQAVQVNIGMRISFMPGARSL
jgi:hypothetical protein